MPDTDERPAPRRPSLVLNNLGDAISLVIDWASLTRGEKLVYAGLLGVLGAALASAGDFDLLAAAAGDTDVNLVRAALFGVFGIPLFAFGYWQVWAVLRPAAPRLAFWLMVTGAFASAVGAAIHGMTALAIEAGGITAGASPFNFGPFARYLVPAWQAAAGAVLVASACFAFTVVSEPTPYPRWTLALAPAVATLILVLLALPFELGRARIVPAAPNLAHGLFFAVSTFIVSRARPR